MKLKEIYESYIDLNREYVLYINDLINKNFDGYSEDEVMKKLVNAKEKFQELMTEIDKFDVEEEEGIFVKDVQYGLVDALFLSIDLYNFYYSKQLERFKMRGINYIRKGRVTSFF